MLLASSISRGDAPFTYKFDDVKSKVFRAPEGDDKREVRVAKGDPAQPEDVVRTGFWATAILSVPERGSRFEIDPSTRVKLAASEPGVLLVLQKGRLKAFFDKLAGDAADERRVAAPGALLAVRGTRYGLEVGSDGTSFLAVFEGTVEVIPTGPGAAPLFVRAQEACTFGPRTPPRAQPMRAMGMSERSWGSHAPGGMRGSGGMGDGSGGMTRGGQQPGTPPSGGMGGGMGQRSGGGH